MSNKVKYNSTGSEPDSLFKGNWAVDVTEPNTGGGPSVSTGLYAGPEVPIGGYVVYNSGVAFTAYTDTELLEYINTIGGVDTDVQSALNWAESQNNILIVDDQFGNIVTSDLVLNLDPTNTMSYDRGESLVDISGAGGSTTFYNSPTYEAESFGAIYLDATNQYIDFEAPGITSDVITVEMWANIGEYNGHMFFGFNRYDIYCYNNAIGFNTAQGDCYGITEEQATEIGVVNHWHHYVFEMHTGVNATTIANNKIWINGVEQSLSQINSSPSHVQANFNGGIGRIGGWRASTGYFMEMYLGSFRIYNRDLTQDEVTQNYEAQRAKYDHMNGYNIVQNGLTVNLDSSYEASLKKIISQIRWYDLSLYKKNVSLTNMVANPIVTDTVPAVSFDGTNDLGAVTKHSANTNTSTTVEIFMRFDDPNIMEPTTAQMNYILSDPQSGSVDGHETRIASNSDQSLPLITYKSRCQYNASTGFYTFYGYMQILGNGMNNYPTIFRKYYNAAGEEQTGLFELNYPEMIDGSFFHYVWSVQNSDIGSRVLKHYLNGNEISGVYGNHTQDWNLFNTISTLRIFEKSYSSAAVFRIYDRPLSASEVLQNYKSCKSNVLYHYTKRENIVYDGLKLCLDAGDNQSFPNRTNTYWYDLTENDNHGTLLNSPAYSNGAIVFDGSNDRIETPIVYDSWHEHDWTISAWLKYDNVTSDDGFFEMTRNGGSSAWGVSTVPRSGKLYFYWVGTSGAGHMLQSPEITNGNLFHVAISFKAPGGTPTQNDLYNSTKTYINGIELAHTSSGGAGVSSGGKLHVGGVTYPFAGSIYSFKYYEKTLTSSEIYQNYRAILNTEIRGYAFKVDAADPNSYPGSGTTVTSVGSETFTSTLESGASYSSENGGVFVFDGTDDIARSTIDNFDLSNTSFTIDCWFKADQELPVPTTWGFVGGGYNNTGMAWGLELQRYGGHGSKALRMDVWGSGHVQFLSSDFNELGWNHYAATFEAPAEGVEYGELKLFLNGSLFGTPGTSVPIANNEMPLEWGSIINSDNIPSGQRAYYSDGRFGPIRIWKNTLTESEILHQYNFEKSRFGL